ncbi:class III lanthionine synthetase LanKC [Bacillus thuringiensis]|uniref:Protein kinase domain-containing protein n=1 Tax=Bacillus thuringiensis TaxID=1428 RepID=A0A9X6Y7Y0_BACTU|nr:class III lanthionine synthetase LanKC [Bacillus thuringiensis]PEA86570.1 hypothetical protein CON71_29080 [Bacillus thuringiensis]
MNEKAIHRYQINRIIPSEWYESFERYLPDEELLKIVRPILPANWTTQRKSIWFNVFMADNKLPLQGWKIHISSIPQHCQDVLRKVASICIQHQIAFKFLLDTRLVTLSGGKMWSREAGGKFITIYPADMMQFKEVIEQLYLSLKDYQGPHILSDQRYKDSHTVYYRYGGIRGYNLLTPEGDKRYYLLSPDGEHHPDLRMPYFTPPSWVDDPFPRDIEEGPEELLLNNGRYRVDTSLNFSMIGGVYLATDLTNDTQVVIKEARPFTQVNADGTDATNRLTKEFDILKWLANSGVAPIPIDLFQDWEHTFLVEEFIDGMPLNKFIVTQIPWKYHSPSDDVRKAYLEKLFKIWANIANCLAACHAKNLVYCDLSLTNVIVQKHNDYAVKLIDFEAGYRKGIDPPSKLITPGFNSPTSGQDPGFEDDIYSLGSIMLATLLPINKLLELDPSKTDLFIQSLGADVGLPEAMLQLIKQCLSHEATKRPTAEQVVDRIKAIQIEIEPVPPAVIYPKEELLNKVGKAAHYIIHSADYFRSDRLYPADPKVFHYHPLNIAYGASGVAYALHKLTGSVPKTTIHWMLSCSATTDNCPPGLYTGFSGISWVMQELGLHEVALHMIEKAYEHPLLWTSASLYSGCSGFGLSCLNLYLATKDKRWLNVALEVGDHIIQTKQDDSDGSYWLDYDGVAWNGLTRGSSGVAFYLLYLSMVTGEGKYLEVGESALAFDLARLKEIELGHVSVPRGKAFNSEAVLSHYWYDGSAGVATVLLRYWAHTKKTVYMDVLEKLAKDTCKKYTSFPSLFVGLSGLGNFLLDFYQFTDDLQYLQEAYHAANGVMLFTLEKTTGIAFPGEQLSRISTDYATGSAGITLFLHRLAHHDQKMNNFNFTLDKLFQNHNNFINANSHKSLDALT